MSEAKYLIGIDLGTSNCAVAFVDPALGAAAPVQDFPVEQLVRPAETGRRPLLPSCLYLPGEHELLAEAMRLPWDPAPKLLAGEFARWQGARVPGRMIASAKSWLCHPGVDRTAPILPWGAPPEVPKLSPLEASARLLSHMAQAWDHAHPEDPLARQEIILTVPASFDEAARALTVTAARQAGFNSFMLLEEPQAAFYDFIARHRQELAAVLEGLRLVLVVDVGGGTSDFTLVQVGLSPEGPALRRIAVGEHLMLGGDNMDAALGHAAEKRLLAGGRRLSSAQWGQLTQAARMAKETLLSAATSRPAGTEPASDNPEYNLSVVAEGSRLVGGALSTRLNRAEVERLILEGFFPNCAPDAPLPRGPRTGLQEMGLPYAQEPAVTKHLAAFLRTHAAAGAAALGDAAADAVLPRPDAILLNGGVFNSPRISERLVAAISAWWPACPPIPLLHHDSLDLAVARGAAYYGLARRGLGRRIGGGAAHALYVGLEQREEQNPLALCVVPRGQEEGETIELGNRLFKLALGRPVRFPLFSTAADRLDRSGAVVPLTEELEPLPPIHTVLTSRSGKAGQVPVHLRALLTEIGTLELWCVAEESGEQWRLEFELRGDAAEPVVTVTEPATASLAEARRGIELIFGGRGVAAAAAKGGPGPKDVKQLWNSLERALGPREDWRLAWLRELWSALLAGAPRRRRSAEHERIFYQLLGFCLRPGFGYALDEWRCEQSAALFAQGVEFHKEKAVWKEFWIMWRRMAGGLSEARHAELWDYLKPVLAQRVPPKPAARSVRLKGPHPEGLDEMARLAGALEHLDPEAKTEFGDWVAARLRQPKLAAGPWTWVLGRLGARAPLYGSAHKVVPPPKAAEWLALLLEPPVIELEGARFAAAQLARKTGDRSRDVDEPVRQAALAALATASTPEAWSRMVREVVVLDAADKARALGDTLPVGLTLA